MQDCKEHDILALTTTVGTLEDAQALAVQLVERRLAACVQIEPIALSVYRWEGRVCQEPEVRLSIKTAPEAREPLVAFLAQHHPYELPQVTLSTLAASAAYADWVRDQTSTDAS